MRWVVLAAAASLVGCFALVADQREVTSQLRWVIRGRELAALARAYCLEGSPTQRRWMTDALVQNQHPATVTLTCLD